MENKVSIIIPTFNRPSDLVETIDSIESQTVKPHELIVVDESTDNAVETTLKNKDTSFKKTFIHRAEKIKSSAISRNIGIKKATGDILLFLDDDVILDNKYIENLHKTYESNKIMAVQGYITNPRIGKRIMLIDRCIQLFFFNSDLSLNCCKIKRGVFGNTYPLSCPSKIRSSEWLSGCNMSFRKSAITKNNLYFNENLLRYAFKEDADLSFRAYKIFRRQGYKSVLNPKMLLEHRVSEEGRIVSAIYTKVKFCYASYFYFKNMNKNILIYYWSLFGHMVQVLLLSLIRRNPDLLIKNINGLKYCIKHLKDIKTGHLRNINRDLFKV